VLDGGRSLESAFSGGARNVALDSMTVVSYDSGRQGAAIHHSHGPAVEWCATCRPCATPGPASWSPTAGRSSAATTPSSSTTWWSTTWRGDPLRDQPGRHHPIQPGPPQRLQAKGWYWGRRHHRGLQLQRRGLRQPPVRQLQRDHRDPVGPARRHPAPASARPLSGPRQPDLRHRRREAPNRHGGRQRRRPGRPRHQLQPQHHPVGHLPVAGLRLHDPVSCARVNDRPGETTAHEGTR
jgi:hypothetical protein